MSEWVEVQGEIKSFSTVTSRRFIVEVLALPSKIVVEYLQVYLDAGTREECEAHPMRGDSGNRACAALTYRYLRPRREMLVNRRTRWLANAPADLGRQLLADAMVRVWEAE